jgi:FtsP/CotA-like multicopper oxidase with cupredoxin domain
MADGLSGPLIVRPAAEPFLYDAEAIFFLQDRYIQSSTEQLIGFFELAVHVDR